MRLLAILLASLLLLTSCSGDGDDSTVQSTESGAATPTALAEIAPEATVAPEPTASDDDAEPAESSTPASDEPTPTPLPAPTAEPTATPEPQPVGIVLPAGRYCYAGDDGINETYVRMTVLDSGEVFGDTRIFISDEENAYFTSAFQRFSGNFNPDASIETRLTTWIEFDLQESTEFWSVVTTGLQTELITIDETPCDVVRNAYVDATLPGTDIGVTADELLDRAFRIDERVSFEVGASSATVSNAVIRGEADRYVLEASGGQLMTVTITALEDNAVVDVVSDSGIALAVETTSTDIFLPHAGDYFIIVSGTSGNASYDLTITII